VEWNKDTIKKFRKKLNLTQVQLAQKLGTSGRLISYWETGKLKPAGISQKALTMLAEKEDIQKDIEEIKKRGSEISSDTIKAFREKLSFSQTQFAEKLGLNLSTISYWESGQSSPSRKSRKALFDMAEEEGIDLEELVKEAKNS